jgi:hypothetical protein
MKWFNSIFDEVSFGKVTAGASRVNLFLLRILGETEKNWNRKPKNQSKSEKIETTTLTLDGIILF